MRRVSGGRGRDGAGEFFLIISVSLLLSSHVFVRCLAFAVLGVYLWEMEE